MKSFLNVKQERIAKKTTKHWDHDAIAAEVSFLRRGVAEVAAGVELGIHRPLTPMPPALKPHEVSKKRTLLHLTWFACA